MDEETKTPDEAQNTENDSETTKVETVEEKSLTSIPSTPSEPKPTSGKFKEMIESIEKMSVLDLSELVKELEDRFGVSAAAPMAMVAGAAPAAAEEEEKDSFTVVIADCGAQKIAVIKAVREIKPDLGLVEAKALVEKGGAEVLKDVKKEEAEEAKKKLEAAGAKVELK